MKKKEKEKREKHLHRLWKAAAGTVLLLCLFAGCTEREQITGGPPLLDTLTGTPVPTPTETASAELTQVPALTEIPEETSVPTLSPTAAPTMTPTITLQPTPEPTETPTPDPTPVFTYTEFEDRTMWTTVNLRIRTLPNQDGETIAVIKKGQKVTVNGRCNETGWYRVDYQGQTGYMSDDYLVDKAPATPTPTPSPTPRVIEFNGDSTLNIKMVGDALIHGVVYKQCKQKDGTYNADILYKNVKDVITAADIAIVNQETILVADEKDYSSYPQFGSPYAIGQAAIDAGFDIIAHATNHTMDKGVDGVMQTLNFWKDKDVTVLGIHESEEESDIAYVSCGDIMISFVNYTYDLNGLESRMDGKPYLVDLLSDKNIEKTVAEAKKNSDLMIAILHVGTEYVYTPSNYAVKQVDRFIDAGADIVLCAHPHVVETYGMRTTAKGNTALVYYSLGNFISAQNKIPRMIGGMADITLGITKEENGCKVEILDYTMTPLVTHIASGEKITTYFLADYTEEQCAKHKYFMEEDYTLSDVWKLWDEMVSEADYLIER